VTRASAFLPVAALALVGCGTELPSVPMPPMPPTSPRPTPPPTQPLSIEGPYYLTTIIDPNCADGFPRSFRRREFAITIRRAEMLSYFDFVTPDTFPSWIRGSSIFPSGSVAADGKIHVILEFYQSGAQSILVFQWSADNTLGYSATDHAIGGLVGGLVTYQDADHPQVECQSAYHQIALTPR
jgi:hypothetical protein